MKSRVTVVDYGLGNLFSVTRALESAGAEAFLTDKAEDILNAESLILPGVAAFADGMAGISERGLVEPLKKFALSGRPFLGLCLGMQMLFDSAEEFGDHKGLCILKGTVRAIPKVDIEGHAHKIPHIGWNELVRPTEDEKWGRSLFAGIPEKSAVYFVHSFRCEPTNPEVRLADTYYNGQCISAAIQSGSVFGCQFHPEKSGPIGLAVLRNFAQFKGAPNA